jgi:hypothetical protein
MAAGVETLFRESTSQALPSPSRLLDLWSEYIHFSRSHILLACIQDAQSMGLGGEGLLPPRSTRP